MGDSFLCWFAYRAAIVKSCRMSNNRPAGGAERDSREPIQKTKKGKTAQPTRRGFAGAYREFLETVDLSELDLDPDQLFEGVRDKSPGRPLP